MKTLTLRAFFALDLPFAVKQQLTEGLEVLKQQWQGEALHWVKPQNLHLTLQFLGEVKTTDLPILLERCHAELKGQKEFYLTLGSLEWFPSLSHPKVLSLKAEPQELLAELSQALRRGAVYSEDRSFRGHLTVARVKGPGVVDTELLSFFQGISLPPLLVKEIFLFRSDLEGSGPRYTPVASLSLENK